MKITQEKQDSVAERWAGWHILTVAEAGFSMLDLYGRHQYGLDINVIRNFADKINERDEPGSLHPQAPISAIPCRFFRDQEKLNDFSVLSEFKRHIFEFIEANRKTIRASRILVDFHVSPEPVPRHYLEATEEIFLLARQDNLIKEVVLFT